MRNMFAANYYQYSVCCNSQISGTKNRKTRTSKKYYNRRSEILEQTNNKVPAISITKAIILTKKNKKNLDDT